MTTTFYLIRHADTGVRNRISGRMPGIHLSPEGREQAANLAERFRGIPIDAIYSSPLERAVETAQPIIESLPLPVLQIAEELNELDYGLWTGKTFDELSSEPEWTAFNTSRAAASIPGGETILQAQARFAGWMDKIRREGLERVAAVSHQDPIRMAVALHLGLHLDFSLRFEIGNASVTIIRLDTSHSSVLTINNVGNL